MSSSRISGSVQTYPESGTSSLIDVASRLTLRYTKAANEAYHVWRGHFSQAVEGPLDLDSPVFEE